VIQCVDQAGRWTMEYKKSHLRECVKKYTPTESQIFERLTIKVIYNVCYFFILFLSTICANDTKVTVASGGIVIEEKDPDIQMISEKLKISPKRIKVEYVFFNNGPDKTIKIGFPLPRSPYNMNSPYPHSSWDEAEIALRLLYGDFSGSSTTLEKALQHCEIIDFSVSVDGERKLFNRHMRAYNASGKDITELLKKHRIPLSSAYLRGFTEEPPIGLFPGLEKKLKILGLLNGKNQPNWYIQTTYVWENKFLFQKHTCIEHTYTPSSGRIFISQKDFTDNHQMYNHIDGSCIDLDQCTYDQKYLREFLKHWEEQSKNSLKPNKTILKNLSEVRYILKTGANWCGPIKKFRLEIKPENPNDLVIIAGQYKMTRMPDGVHVIELEDFTPKEDIRVWFISSENTPP
jgi:hypothetical protein